MDQFPDVEAQRVQLLSTLKKKSTPMFFVDTNILTDRYQELTQALENHWKKHIVAYSFKTNYAVARTFCALGAWSEVVSGKEYDMARHLGYSGEKIIFNGPLKRNEELLRAIKDDTLIHVDNREELQRIDGLTKNIRIRARIGIRLNASIHGIKPSRFGFSIEHGDAHKAAELIGSRRNLILASTHLHIGTNIDDPCAYKTASRKVGQFIWEIKNRGSELQYIDMGGGFPAHGLPPFGVITWAPRPIEQNIKAITEGCQEFPSVRNLTLIVEPGRYLVDDAVTFITSAYSVTRKKRKQIITVDATVSMLPLVHYQKQIVRVFTNDLMQKRGGVIPTIAYGSTCREDDVLYQGELPAVSVGDLVVFYCVGAYNQSMGSEFIFPKPGTITV